MTRDSKICCAVNRRYRVGAPWLVGLLLLLTAQGIEAESSRCKRARQIVQQVEAMPAATAADHRARLQRLGPARNLCTSLGELWRVSYCSALFLENGKEEFYKKQAVLNGVDSLSCAGALSSPSPHRTPLSPYVRRKFALVIGVGQFEDPKIPTLRYTAKDARDFADVLVQHAHFEPGNVELLVEEQATRANILSGIQRLILTAQKEDLVVLFVSTHGSPNKASQGLQGIGYIVTHDTALENIWVDAIEYQDFARKVALIKARRMVTFLDTCFSGQAFHAAGAKQLTVEGVGVAQDTAELFVSGEGSYVITSSRFDEQSWESERLTNSYFTHFLIESLRRGPEPPSIQTVFDELSFEVTRAVARDKGMAQNPQIHPSNGLADVRIGVLPIPSGSSAANLP